MQAMQKGVRALPTSAPSRAPSASLPMAKPLPKWCPLSLPYSLASIYFPSSFLVLEMFAELKIQAAQVNSFSCILGAWVHWKDCMLEVQREEVYVCVREREALKATRGVKERFSPECDWLFAPLSRGTLSPWKQDVAGSQWNDSEVAQEGSQPPGRTVPVEVPDYIPTITRVGIRRERLPTPNHCNDLNYWLSRIIMWSGGREKEESSFKNVSWAWKIIFQVKKELWYLHIILMEM